MGTVNYCGLSGGKDSQVTALWLLHESGVPKESIRFTFCNTHNEHEYTYEHVRMLSRRFQEWGGPEIVWLEPERGFYELAKWKGRFPSAKARFCTQFLKVVPTREDIQKIIREGNDVVVYSGVRHAEGGERSKLQDRGFDDMFGCEVVRPILKWTREQVVEFSHKYGVPLNPLYSLGARRVGCLPCVNSTKREIRMIAEKFPERIYMIRNAELEIGGGQSSFFHAETVPPRYRRHEFRSRNGEGFKVCNIDDVVEWSKTGRRAIKLSEPLFAYEPLVCEAGRGMCE